MCYSKKKDYISKKIIHWKKIAISACQQCNRNIVPKIHNPNHLIEWCKNKKNSDTKILFNKESLLKINKFSKSIQRIQLLIGPEGGFSSEEIKEIINSGFVSISLGPRKLRTETAALAAMTALQMRFGDLS